MSARDPGYGSATAQPGTEQWAKWWRLSFQGTAKELPHEGRRAREHYDEGVKYRAWTLLTDSNGKHFPDFDAFCACPQPYGLGMEPAKFRAYLEAEVGKKAADLATVAPGEPGAPLGNRNAAKNNGDTMSPLSETDDAAERKAKRLRAILRAPEVVQDLYRQGKVSQTTAARLGPRRPTPEQAARVAEARQKIEQLDLSKPAKEVRKAVDRIVSETVGLPKLSPLEAAKKAFLKLDVADRGTFLNWASNQIPAAGCLFA